MAAPESSPSASFEAETSPRYSNVVPALLAAAHADGVICGREQRTVGRIMLRLSGDSELEPELAGRIRIVWSTVFGQGARRNAY